MSEICTTCNGTGICQNCGGLGTIRCSHCNGTGQIRINCPTCGGSGTLDGETCFRCNGTGQVDDKCDVCNGAGNFDCNQCHSSGKCKDCGGTGKIGNLEEKSFLYKYSCFKKETGGGGWHSSGFISFNSRPCLGEIVIVQSHGKKIYCFVRFITHCDELNNTKAIWVEEVDQNLVSELRLLSI